MSSLLTEYEARIQKRESQLTKGVDARQKIEVNNLKFSPDGEIKPFYGLTCIIWVDEKSELHSILSAAQRSIQTELINAGVDQLFFFLEPASFHMTICDITASSTPLTSSVVETVSAQIQEIFTNESQTAPITAQVRGLGLTSTITALVHFQQETELQKALHLESKIKQATQVDVRDFLGHITLAYCVKSPNTELGVIQEILHPYKGRNFGELAFSEFDLTYFTDMNTYRPLSTTDFVNGKVQNHTTCLENVSPPHTGEETTDERRSTQIE